MCYYYTVREYAAIKRLDLSVQDEAEAVACATMLSNKRGIPINKINCGNSGSNMNCYASHVLRETFRPSGKTVEKLPEKTMAGMLA